MSLTSRFGPFEEGETYLTKEDVPAEVTIEKLFERDGEKWASCISFKREVVPNFAPQDYKLSDLRLKG